MKDEIIDCLAYNGKVSIKCISSREIVEKARKLHDLSPTASAALGRLLTITSIMGYELKTEEASITNQIKGNGPQAFLLCHLTQHEHFDPQDSHRFVLRTP